MFSDKSLGEKKRTGKNVLEEILSSAALPLLCCEVSSDWLNLGKVIPTGHSAASKF